jgi:hypothetical protein
MGKGLAVTLLGGAIILVIMILAAAEHHGGPPTHDYLIANEKDRCVRSRGYGDWNSNMKGRDGQVMLVGEFCDMVIPMVLDQRQRDELRRQFPEYYGRRGQ